MNTQYTHAAGAHVPGFFNDINLAGTHVVDVKKGGLYVGIYVKTKSNRRRGVILPYAAWTALLGKIDTVNLGIDFERGLALSGEGSLYSNQDNGEYTPYTQCGTREYHQQPGGSQQTEVGLYNFGSNDTYEHSTVLTTMPAPSSATVCEAQSTTDTRPPESWQSYALTALQEAYYAPFEGLC